MKILYSISYRLELKTMKFSGITLSEFGLEIFTSP